MRIFPQTLFSKKTFKMVKASKKNDLVLAGLPALAWSQMY